MPLTVEFAFRSIASSMVALPQSRVFGIGLPCAQLAPHFGIVKSSLISRGFATSKWGFSENIRGSSVFSVNSADILGSSSLTSDRDGYTVPIPIVMIDQDSDPDATIVEISFGDRLGALIDTMKAIKDLGLDVTKGRVTTEAGVLKTIFFITKMGRKIEDPSMLERIRLTIINNLLKYHPESSERLALGEAFGIKAPQEKLDIDVATHIHVQNDGPKRSLLYIETADRPGLLLEIIKMMADINVNVESAEIDTEGLVAKDKFYVSYRGAALGGPLSQVLVNSLRYYLRRPETEEDSY
ncbi:ACT domain-containing protein ACR12-like isoform X1 [Phalaenopsis equestris]|uniref:ACT domain-containing protein ACR12-like isoform X1 n=1 Tax=Phalaenopsis equestris TaxID=78828 RepID=UPI0009E3D0D8|nr:ACT domain-containing protein ACR12-like isoform X1 [Phalaenopsis equestris]